MIWLNSNSVSVWHNAHSFNDSFIGIIPFFTILERRKNIIADYKGECHLQSWCSCQICYCALLFFTRGLRPLVALAEKVHPLRVCTFSASLYLKAPIYFDTPILPRLSRTFYWQKGYYSRSVCRSFSGWRSRCKMLSMFCRITSYSLTCFFSLP